MNNFDKYLAGEWYPGCPVGKSEWRKATEADFAARGVVMDSRTNVARVVAKKAPVSRPKKVRIVKEPESVLPKVPCKECGKPLRKDNKTGYCELHFLANRYELANGPRPTCKECSAPINRSNEFGLCRKHALTYYQRRASAKFRSKAA